jgi:hypothetical protein
MKQEEWLSQFLLRGSEKVFEEDGNSTPLSAFSGTKRSLHPPARFPLFSFNSFIQKIKWLFFFLS